MKRRITTLAILFLSIGALALVLYPLAGAMAQHRGGGNPGGNPGGGGGNGNGNKPPVDEESTNNLSYPAYFYGTALWEGTIGDYSLGAVLQTGGVGVSYGCNIPETIETTTTTTTYPNTSCVQETADGLVALDKDACQTVCEAAQEAAGLTGDFSIERIYWQKNSSNTWQAGYTWVTPSYEDGKATNPLKASHIDWGDNLEGRTWPAGILRVETNTFSTLPLLNPDNESPLFRFDMWHVFGQGTNELWGVRTPDADPPNPYVYVDVATETDKAPNWPYAVNVSPTAAHLNIAKLAAGFPDGGCPTTATGITQSPYSPTWHVGEGGLGYWEYENGDGTTDEVPYDDDYLYGAELNIKGSYVYGYNWNLRAMSVPEDVGKAGWWRLTFYTTDNSIVFDEFVPPDPTDPTAVNTLAPPASEDSTPDVFVPSSPTMVQARIRAGITAVEAEGDSGLMLYVPQVNKENQLTYLDVCIAEGKAGGGGGKKGGN